MADSFKFNTFATNQNIELAGPNRLLFLENEDWMDHDGQVIQQPNQISIVPMFDTYSPNMINKIQNYNTSSYKNQALPSQPRFTYNRFT